MNVSRVPLAPSGPATNSSGAGLREPKILRTPYRWMKTSFYFKEVKPTRNFSH